MASDKKKFEIALNKWQHLYEERLFSVAPNVGYIAIVCSSHTEDVTPAGPAAVAESQGFYGEAIALMAWAVGNGRKPRLIDNPTNAVMRDDIIADPEITDIITIGHGSLSCMFLPGKNFDWADVSGATTHLKTGSFIQRHCGTMKREFSLPMGTFALADITKVIAPAGKSFTPRSLDDVENKKLIPIFSGEDTPLTDYQKTKKILGKIKQQSIRSYS